MEKPKYTACLEITSDFAKFIVGYSLGSSPVLLYSAKKDIHSFMKNGDISDAKGVENAISGFLKLNDEALSLKISASTVSLVVPPLGFEVYQNNKTTNVIAGDGIVEKIDISNVMSLVKKEQVPNGNVIVDIVPDDFVLDNGKIFANPPLGEKTNSLTIEAKVHTLPEQVLYRYKRTVEEAGFRVSRTCVATYCSAELLSTEKSLPDSYFYVDMGARITTVSLIGGFSPFGSLFFLKGGDDLTSAIAGALSLSPLDAETVKTRYGYDTRHSGYEAPIAVGEEGTSFYQKDLNAVIAAFFKDYNGFLSNAIQTLLKRQPANALFETLPVIVAGGGSSLIGLNALLSPSLGQRKLIPYVPMVLGARDPSLVNLLGLLVAEGSYRGTLEDNYHGVSTLSRDK